MPNKTGAADNECGVMILLSENDLGQQGLNLHPSMEACEGTLDPSPSLNLTYIVSLLLCFFGGGGECYNKLLLTPFSRKARLKNKSRGFLLSTCS